MTAGLFANPIDEGQALDIATQFGRKAEAGSKLRSFAERNHLEIVYKADRNAGKDAYYYVAQSRVGGYIIVSGEDRTASVLGFVDSGSFDINDIILNSMGVVVSASIFFILHRIISNTRK